MACPSRPPPDARAVVAEYTRRFEEKADPKPEWSRNVCNLREFFLRTALALEPGNADIFAGMVFLVVLAFQQPCGPFALMRRRCAPRQWPALEARGCDEGWAHRLRPERYVPEYELFDEEATLFGEDNQLWVFEELFWEDNELLLPRCARPF